jgi:enoyl-CoA hydratase
MSEVAEPELLVERRGRLGVLTLNRPRAINALTHGMVLGVLGALEDWRDDDSVHALLITGAGERGLCAGGDIVALYNDATSGDGAASARFWADEYRMNSLLGSYPKPIVAIQDGLVLGGGIGISAHCSHRIVTERSSVGLPEVGIGFVPDVGATWLLARAPGELGVAAALAGRRLGAGDAIALGLSDAFVPSDHLLELRAALEIESPDDAIARHSHTPPVGELASARHWIDAAFSADSVDVILQLLGSVGEEAAPFVAAIEAASPTAVAVTLESLRRAGRLRSLDETLVQEYRVSMHALGTHDFAEGVRAQVIEKDRNPRWEPPTTGEVERDAVLAYFESPAGGDLDLMKKEQR